MLYILIFISLICCEFSFAFQTSVNPEFSPLFKNGLTMLHNFQYDDAEEIFLELQQKDPGFSLGYWGEAMIYNHSLWNEQDFEKGLFALQKFANSPDERVAKATTPIEKGLIHAINLLYGTGNKKFRDNVYAASLQDLHQQFPEDDEIAVFYALAILGKEQGVRNYPEYLKAASIANEVFERNPLHPGALHYLIHSVDDPLHAPLGLQAARAYSQAATESSHAAHMPSHIYLALGLWDEVIDSNLQAWECGQRRLVRKKLPEHEHDIHDLHALQWLHYGYLQKGDFRKRTRFLNKCTPWLKCHPILNSNGTMRS